MKRLSALFVWLSVTLAVGAITLTEYLPSQPSTTAVIVCPGGSYFWLDSQTEGDSVARSLQQAGIAAYVLKYRTGGISSVTWRSSERLSRMTREYFFHSPSSPRRERLWTQG